MEAWIAEKLAETSLGGYTLMMACLWWLGQNMFKIVTTWNDSRRLTLEEKQANREGFTAIVTATREEVNGLREENRALRKEYDDHRRICQEETEQLRNEVQFLESRLAGLFRKIADIAIRITRKDVDASVVQAIIELAAEAEHMSRGRGAQ